MHSQNITHEAQCPIACPCPCPLPSISETWENSWGFTEPNPSDYLKPG